jgi:hypothetical protein
MISLLTAIMGSVSGMANRGTSGITSRRYLSPSAEWTRKYFSREGALHLKANAPMESLPARKRGRPLCQAELAGGARARTPNFGAHGTGDCGVEGGRGEGARLPARIHEVVSSRRFLAKSCTSARGMLAIGIGGHWPTFQELSHLWGEHIGDA